MPTRLQEHPTTEFTLEEATSWLSGLSDEARAIIEAAIDLDLDKQLKHQHEPFGFPQQPVTH